MKVYYYTRTGRSEKIANELAVENGFDVCEIKDGKNWAGIFNYLKAGALASQKKSIKAKYEKPLKGEDILLVFPVWAGQFPPTIRSFLEENKRENIIAVPTSLGTKLKDQDGFKAVYDLVGKEIKAPKIEF